jgi:hypothetical protein
MDCSGDRMGLGVSHDVNHLGEMAPPSLWLPLFLGVLCRAEPFSEPENSKSSKITNNITETDRIES